MSNNALKAAPAASRALSTVRAGTAEIAVLESGQYLTFSLSGEMFAIGILAIKEIIEYGDMTTVPMMPPGVRGVINLRGTVVPVVDLRARFGWASSQVTKRTCIVIVESRSGKDVGRDGLVVGVLVDAVNEVIEIAAGDVEPPPEFGASIRTDFIQGMGKVKGRFVILLNVEQALCQQDMSSLSARTGSIAATLN